MDPVFIEIFGRPVYWYGVMTALGFLAAVAHWSLLGRRESRPDGLASELGIWVMVCGILGARIAYVLANLHEYRGAPVEMLRIDKGGLVYYGGLIGATLGILVLARLRHQPVWRFGDFVITAVPLGHAIGRFGCFLNGCCYGTPCDLPWAVEMQDVVRHPTQLYEVGYNLLVYGVLLWAYTRKPRPGTVVALYLLLYPAGRFVFEFIRGDTRLQWAGLTVAQCISIGLMAAGCVLLFLLSRGRNERHG